MTTRWCKKAPRIAFIVFLIVSIILAISILVALRNGAFSKTRNSEETPPNSSSLASSHTFSSLNSLSSLSSSSLSIISTTTSGDIIKNGK